MAEPGGLPSMGLHRIGRDWSDLAAAAAATLLNFISLYQRNNTRFPENLCNVQVNTHTYHFSFPRYGHYRHGKLIKIFEFWDFSSVQSLSCVRLFETPWTAALQASLSITSSRSPLKLMFIKLVISANHFILCHPLLFPPPIFCSIRVFSNESALHTRWSKYWSFSFSISPSNEYSGLISFRIDWLDLLAVQETLKNLLQHHSSKASILQHSAFFTVQLSHPYIATGKTIALTRWTFVGKVMSLLFNMLSRLVTTFLPRSKCLLIS